MIKESLFSSTDLPEPIDRFIHDLIEGQETVRVETKTEKDSLQAVIKLDIESQNLPPIELRKFFGNPGEWSEFIENFKTRVHEKALFTDSKCFKEMQKKVYVPSEIIDFFMQPPLRYLNANLEILSLLPM